MMNNATPVACTRWAEKLAGTHPRDLLPSDRVALNAHLATCANCAAVFADYRAMDARILNLPAVEPLTGLSWLQNDRNERQTASHGRGMADVSSIPALKAGVPQQPVPRKRRIASLASSFAAVLVVGAVIASFLLLWANHRILGSSSGSTPVVPAPTVHTQAVTTNCPSTGTARSAVMPSLILGNHDTLIYVDNEPGAAFLKRYDAVTRQNTNILRLANTTIADAQLAANGQWVLFASTAGTEGSSPVKIQLVRVDGKYIQTLYCSDPLYGNFLWSPNMQTVLFAEGNSFPLMLYTLNLATGKVQPMLRYSYSDTYSLIEWRDSTRAYLVDSGGNLYLLDITKGPNQTKSDLQLILKAWPGSFDQCLDGTQLYISTYTGRAKSPFGPSKVEVKTLASGNIQTVYQSKTQAVDTLNAFSSTGLLFTIDTYVPVGGDTSQLGLWSLDLFGGGVKHLLNLTQPFSLNMFSRDPWSNVARNGEFYALKIETVAQDTLVVGSMNGGSYTTINARSQDGWTYSGAVGWTTM